MTNVVWQKGLHSILNFYESTLCQDYEESFLNNTFILSVHECQYRQSSFHCVKLFVLYRPTASFLYIYIYIYFTTIMWS